MAEAGEKTATVATAANPSSPPPPYSKLAPLDKAPEIKDPISYTSNGAQVLYSKASQEYYLVTAAQPPTNPPTLQYYLLAAIPKQPVSKAVATKLLQSVTDFDQLCARFPSSFPKLVAAAPSDETLVPKVLVYLNALYDSIIVKRNSGDASIASFYADKYVIWNTVGKKTNFIFLFRADHVSSCSCSELETVGSVVYCKGCTTYYRCIINNAPDGQSATMQYVPITNVGTLVFSGILGREIMLGMCGGTTRLVMDKAVYILAHLFRLAKLSEIPLPREQILFWALRDSLFLGFPHIKICWYDQWLGPQAQAAATAGANNAAAANGVVAAVGLARLGLAIATLGMIS
ncbi:hypothetical protein NLG97_g7310 [Lecanicillium saksenae]|uniref:Uncharacterized protein n=1 Tax=Lecanicillium saksenae TaxID=468837 RepID=A0ACC1QQ60_9HYPO|nr:hypothetical protein NLG97_g7310 [Lecanicillium saksenae]